MNFTFANPHLLWLLLLLPVIMALKGKIGPSTAITFSNTEIAQKVSKLQQAKAGRILFFLQLFSIGLLIIALARPQKLQAISEVEASGVDIVLAVDISQSMLALDFTQDPKNLLTRLDVAKKVILEFIEKRPNDRIGLIAFAGEPYIISPLTLNHNWLEQNVERLKVGLISGGTAIGSAIAMSANRLRDLPSKTRIIILLTDGANNAGSISPIAAAEAASLFKTKIYTIAAGHSNQVPTLLLNPKGDIATNWNGKPIIRNAQHTIDEESLQEIAEITGGKFYEAHSVQELENIYNEIDKLEKTDVKLQKQILHAELFHLPAILGLLILTLGTFLSYTRFQKIP